MRGNLQCQAFRYFLNSQILPEVKKSHAQDRHETAKLPTLRVIFDRRSSAGVALCEEDIGKLHLMMMVTFTMMLLSIINE